MYTITLADGTQLKNLTLNGTNYIAPGVIEGSVFENNLSKVIISDGMTTETHYDMVLIQSTTIFSGGKQSWFVLAEKTQQQKKEAYEKEITDLQLEVTVMGNIIDSMLIEQLSEKGLILHE